MKNSFAILVSIVVIICVSCSGYADKKYIEANNAWFETNAPQFREYVKSDEKLNDSQREAVILSLDQIQALNSERAASIEKSE